MAVKTKLQPDYDADAIVELAGYSPDDAWVQDGWLYIEGPSQSAINQAKASYISDHDTNHLARQKKLANDDVDQKAERARSRLLRTLPGQSIVHLKKETEADAYISAGYPIDLTNYPWIAGEVDITGYTATAIADSIVAQRVVDLDRDVAVEKERQRTKIEINNQLGPQGVQVARNALDANLADIESTFDLSDSAPPTSNPGGGPGNNPPVNPGNAPREFGPPDEIVSREIFISPQENDEVMDRALLKSVDIVTPHDLIQIEEPKEEAVERYEAPELTFDEIVEEALYTVEAMVENTRQVYLGVGPAQMMVYVEKFNEASDYIVDDMPEDTSRYPFINAEVGATGKPAEEVANNIIDMKGAWITFNANAERIRMVAKTHILESNNESSVDQIVKLASEQLDKMLD